MILKTTIGSLSIDTFVKENRFRPLYNFITPCYYCMTTDERDRFPYTSEQENNERKKKIV